MEGAVHVMPEQNVLRTGENGAAKRSVIKLVTILVAVAYADALLSVLERP